MASYLKLTALLSLLLLNLTASPLLADETDSNDKRASVKEISAIEASELIKNNGDKPDFIILDVRTSEEFSSGHIENAVNIDVTSSWFIGDVQKLGKDNTFLIHCRSGSRSERAIAIMKESGFTDIYEIDGGISEWESQGLPVVK